MFQLVELLLHFINRKEAKEQKERYGRMNRLIADLSVSPVEETKEFEDQVLDAAEEAARADLCLPETAVFDDESIARSGTNFVACGHVFSKNHDGTGASNYFLVEVTSEGKAIFCELIESDPRPPKTK